MARQIRHSDKSGKRLFSHRRVVADFVRLLGTPWVDDLDLDRLEPLPAEHVTDDLRARRADLPWWAPFRSPQPGSAWGLPLASRSPQPGSARGLPLANKERAGWPAGAGVMFHLEFQSSPDARMVERLLEYVVLLRRDLHRSGWMAAAGGRIVAHVPLVVYNGRAKWRAPLQLDERGWMPRELRALQPRLACRLVDAKNFADDDAADRNLARAVLALDAASAEGLPLALARAETLFSAADDRELWWSFVAWCGGILSPRLGGRPPILVHNKETTMLAETLRERDELKIDEGRRGVLCSLASRRFGAATGAELAALLAGVKDGAELERIGTLIIDCGSGSDFLARARLR